ncbi:DMT family transporter [Lysinibacillus xylanilyticus]|uniref:DMT family transporter n=1 Tax=Lysinibacillus TaxID=400634 RepID=UPI0036418240
MIGYLYLVIAVLVGTSGHMFVKKSNGFEIKSSGNLALVCFTISIYFISLSVKFIEVGVVFAIWAGLTIVLVNLINILFYNESKNVTKILGIACIILGVITLKIF